MNISEILTPSSTFCSLELTSKKKVIEKISEVMAESINCPAEDIYESLFAREKLGTTALGNGIAIPHGRVEACDAVTAVFILLEEPIDYDAPDGKPVDVIFSILVPQQADSNQLKCLAEVAKVLSEPNIVSQIRHAHCGDALFDIIDKASERIQ